MSFPLSLTLSPFVPHGERGLARRDVSSRLDIFAQKPQRKSTPEEFCLTPFASSGRGLDSDLPSTRIKE